MKLESIIDNINCIHDINNTIDVTVFLPIEHKMRYVSKIKTIISDTNTIILPNTFKKFIKGNYTFTEGLDERLVKYAEEVRRTSIPVKNLIDLSGFGYVRLAKTLDSNNIETYLNQLNNLIKINYIYDIIEQNDIKVLKPYLSTLFFFIERIHDIKLRMLDVLDYENPYNTRRECAIYDTLSYILYNNISVNNSILKEELKFIIRHLDKFSVPVRYKLYEVLLSQKYNTSLLNELKKVQPSDDDLREPSLIDGCRYSGLEKYLQSVKIPFIDRRIVIDTSNSRDLIISGLAEVLTEDYFRNNLLSPELDFLDNEIINIILKNELKPGFTIEKIFIKNMTIILCIEEKNKFILLKNTKSSGYALMPVTMSTIDDIRLNRECRELIRINHSPSPIDAIQESFNLDIACIKNDVPLSVLTEGISVNKNGDITFKFSKKKSFMTQYAENHRELVNNIKVNNIEGAKGNLAFLFAMISVIERDYIYSKKQIADDKMEDAKKARMFARNDFVTYLPQIQKVEKDFDFSKYYHDNDYDKFIMTLPNDSIDGIRKIVTKLILLKN